MIWLRRVLVFFIGFYIGTILFSACTPKVRPLGLARISYPTNGACSAVVISDTEALTAAHCMNETVVQGGMYMLMPLTLPVTLHQGNVSAQGLLEYSSYMRDLAIINGDFRAFTRPPGIAGRAYMRLGRRYTSCGHPMGQRSAFCVSLGEFVTNDVALFVFKQPILFGMSGGPVYDEETGELVGLNTAIYPRQHGGGSAITPVLGLEGEKRAVGK